MTLEGYSIFKDIVEALSLTMDLVERQRNDHAKRIATLSVNLGERLNMTAAERRDLFFAGLLHDVGQIGTPDEILYKQGALTLDEQSAIWLHSHVGYEIVREIPTLEGAALYIRWHHERWDGTGYPDRLNWAETPVGSQLIAICDTFDALLNDRPWRKALTKDQAIDTLKKFASIQFNPQLVQELLPYLEDVEDNQLWRLSEETEHMLERETRGNREFSQLKGDRIMKIITLFSKVVDAKHKYTSGHSRRVATLARQIGAHLGLAESELTRLEIAGLLHDTGKVAISSLVVDKPGRLTEEEFESMKQYPTISQNIVNKITNMEDIALAVRHHHERFDGSGYPDGLTGDQIPLYSRILAVADTYEAMSTDRAYRKRLKHEQIIKELRSAMGTQFDPAIGGILNEDVEFGSADQRELKGGETRPQ